MLAAKSEVGRNVRGEKAIEKVLGGGGRKLKNLKKNMSRYLGSVVTTLHPNRSWNMLAWSELAHRRLVKAVHAEHGMRMNTCRANAYYYY